MQILYGIGQFTYVFVLFVKCVYGRLTMKVGTGTGRIGASRGGQYSRGSHLPFRRSLFNLPKRFRRQEIIVARLLLLRLLGFGFGRFDVLRLG